MSLKAELDTASNFNRKYYGTYFVNLSKRNPEGVRWVRCRYALGRSHYINCKENLTECEECHNQRCSHSITKCMECEKSICNICTWTCELACKDQHLKGNMSEFQSCSSCKNTKPINLPFPRRNNMVTSPPLNRAWWRKPTVDRLDQDNHDNRVGGYTNNMLENLRKQYLINKKKDLNNKNNKNNNHSDNDSNDNDNENKNKNDDSNDDDDDDSNQVSNRAWWLKKPEKKWDSDYNNMIAKQKANYQQTLIDNINQWDDTSNNSVKSSDEEESEDEEEEEEDEADGDNSSRSQNSDESSGFVSDIRNKSLPKLLYDWTDDDDENIEQMWGNH